MSRLRNASAGQSTVEYVGVLLLVAIALGGIALVSSGGGPRLGLTIARAFCRVLGASCPRLELALAPPLAPCPVSRSAREEEASATVGVIAVGIGDSIAVARGSDGGISVSLLDHGDAGLTAGVGAHFELPGRWGGATGSAAASATAKIGFTTGLLYRFRDPARGAAFIARYRHRSSIAGRTEDTLKGLCIVCHVFGVKHEPFPRADAVFVEGGPSAAASAQASSGGWSAGFKAAIAGALGARESRSGTTTFYYRLDESVAGDLDAVVASAGGTGRVEGLLEYRVARDGRPLSLRFQSVRGWTGRLALAGHARNLPELERGLRRGGASLGGSTGQTLEYQALLDLRRPANRRASQAVIDGLRRDPLALPRLVRRLGRRMAVDGTVDLRTFATHDRQDGIGAGGRLGVGLSGDYANRTTIAGLVDAYTRPPGDRFLRRVDCLDVARRRAERL